MFRSLLARLEKSPIASFIVIVALLFGVIAVASTLRAPEEAEALPEQSVKTSRLFETGIDGSRLSVSAQVKKSSVVDIVALTPGVVKSIAVRPGQSVVSGQIVATLTADYASGAAALAQERAALQTSLTERTYKIEKEIIDLQKEITDDDSAKSDAEEDLAKEQRRLELERLKLSRETARIDLALAQRSDATLRPRALVKGTVEHIAVRAGDLVSAGTVLMTLHASATGSTLEAAFPKKLADTLMEAGIAELTADGETHTLSQGYRAKSETAAGLVIVTYPLSDTLSDSFAQHDYVTLSVPLVASYRTGYLVPIDAIRSTSKETSVVVMDTDHLTHDRTVVLGETVGASVVVKSGLERGDLVVLDASVLPGDKIEPIR